MGSTTPSWSVIAYQVVPQTIAQALMATRSKDTSTKVKMNHPDAVAQVICSNGYCLEWLHPECGASSHLARRRRSRIGQCRRAGVTRERLARLDSNHAAVFSASIWRNQLNNGFELLKVWSAKPTIACLCRLQEREFQSSDRRGRRASRRAAPRGVIEQGPVPGRERHGKRVGCGRQPAQHVLRSPSDRDWTL
jgi:hypothetical protein